MGEKLYLVSPRHDDSNEFVVGPEVAVCSKCGIVFAPIARLIGKCSLGHDQLRGFFT